VLTNDSVSTPKSFTIVFGAPEIVVGLLNIWDLGIINIPANINITEPTTIIESLLNIVITY
jgi:hypothetical protein